MVVDVPLLRIVMPLKELEHADVKHMKLNKQVVEHLSSYEKHVDCYVVVVNGSIEENEQVQHVNEKIIVKHNVVVGYSRFIVIAVVRS